MWLIFKRILFSINSKTFCDPRMCRFACVVERHEAMRTEQGRLDMQIHEVSHNISGPKPWIAGNDSIAGPCILEALARGINCHSWVSVYCIGYSCWWISNILLAFVYNNKLNSWWSNWVKVYEFIFLNWYQMGFGLVLRD